MTDQEAMADGCPEPLPSATEVMELMLLLPDGQFHALEEVANGLSLTVAQLLRRTVGDFLMRDVRASTGRVEFTEGEIR